jgi:hypothetical protein
MQLDTLEKQPLPLHGVVLHYSTQFCTTADLFSDLHIYINIFNGMNDLKKWWVCT